MSPIPDRTCGLLHRAMALRLDRMHLLASNIANVDTPGYTPVDMDFEQVFVRSLEAEAGLARTSERHLTAAPLREESAGLYYDPAGTPGLDGNTVSLDRETAKMSENMLQYDAAARALQKKLAMLRYAVNDGGV